MMSLENNIRGIIFDFGGTIDTNGCHWGKFLWHFYQQMGVTVTEKQFRDAYVYGERALETYSFIKPEHTFRQTLSIKLRLELEQLCMMGAWNANENQLHSTHEALLNSIYIAVKDMINAHHEVIKQLAQHYKMVLTTNFYGNMQQVLQEFSLANYFENIIESATINIRKPDVRIFKLSLEALNLEPSEVVTIGDSYYKDIEPAHKLGCNTIWLKGEGWTNKQYNETIPTHIITDFKQLTSLLLPK